MTTPTAPLYTDHELVILTALVNALVLPRVYRLLTPSQRKVVDKVRLYVDIAQSGGKR